MSESAKSFSNILKDIAERVGSNTGAAGKSAELFNYEFGKYDENQNFENRKCDQKDLLPRCQVMLEQCLVKNNEGFCFTALNSDLLIDGATYVDGPAGLQLLKKLGFQTKTEGSPYGPIKVMESLESFLKRGGKLPKNTPIPTAASMPAKPKAASMPAKPKAASMPAKPKAASIPSASPTQDTAALLAGLNKAAKGMASASSKLDKKMATQKGATASPSKNDLMADLKNSPMFQRQKKAFVGGANVPPAIIEIVKRFINEINTHPKLLNPHLDVDAEGFLKAKTAEPKATLALYTLARPQSGGYLGELAAMDNIFKLESNFMEQNGGAEFAPGLDRAATSRYEALNNSLEKLLVDLKSSDRALDESEEREMRQDLAKLRKTEQKAYIANEYLKKYLTMVKNGQVDENNNETFMEIVNKKGKLEKKVEKRYIAILGNLNALASVVAVVPQSKL